MFLSAQLKGNNNFVFRKLHNNVISRATQANFTKSRLHTMCHSKGLIGGREHTVFSFGPTKYDV